MGTIPKHVAALAYMIWPVAWLMIATIDIFRSRFVLFRFTHLDVVQSPSKYKCYTEALFVPDTCKQKVSMSKHRSMKKEKRIT